MKKEVTREELESNWIKNLEDPDGGKGLMDNYISYQTEKHNLELAIKKCGEKIHILQMNLDHHYKNIVLTYDKEISNDLRQENLNVLREAETKLIKEEERLRSLQISLQEKKFRIEMYESSNRREFFLFYDVLKGIFGEEMESYSDWQQKFDKYYMSREKWREWKESQK
jgi:hypothetical protein